jgi:hypothetical protein
VDSFYETESEILAMFGLLCSLELMNFLYILKLFRLAFSLDDNKRGKNDVLNIQLSFIKLQLFAGQNMHVVH